MCVVAAAAAAAVVVLHCAKKQSRLVLAWSPSGFVYYSGFSSDNTGFALTTTTVYVQFRTTYWNARE